MLCESDDRVIAYYADADGQFSTNKIGYDVDLFDEAVRNIAFGELRKKQDPSPQADDHLNTKLRDLTVQNEQRQDGVDTVSIKKEDVQFIVRSPLLLEKTSTSIKTNNREYFHGLTR
jgi:hypothetical protein